MKNIRNFCIIAHVDHGKSTLADRLIEDSQDFDTRHLKDQVLDKMDLEREKGITIKLQPIRMHWRGCELNLIDTPGHVDFAYEVSRSLAAVEGALLVIDASQGIQAQTLSNLYQALEADLDIIPVINKIDLPAANPDKVAAEIMSVLGCSKEDIVFVSAKTGQNISAVLDAVIDRVRPPKEYNSLIPKALIFDSVFNDYRGVILYIRMVQGSIRDNQQLYLIGSQKESLALEVGHFGLDLEKDGLLQEGQIGYVITNLKTTIDARVGDSLTSLEHKRTNALPGYKEAVSFVFAGIFPVSSEDYGNLKVALEKLRLNDSALNYTNESSLILGLGFRVGFLGLLHLEIVQARLEREYRVDVIVTSPSVESKVILKNQQELIIRRADELPDSTEIDHIMEPWVSGELMLPSKSLGPVLTLLSKARGIQKNISYINNDLVLVEFESPLSSIVTNFYDDLKSITSGYGSFSYQPIEYRSSDLVRLDFIIASEKIDNLSLIVYRGDAEYMGRKLVSKIKEMIPRQMFEVSIQAAVGSKILARETISSIGKNVTAKLYGGDVTRKRKLIEKQKSGKKKMKRIGKVDIPTTVFKVLIQK